MADPTTDLDALVARMRELHAPDPEEPGSCFLEYPCEMPKLLDAIDALRVERDQWRDAGFSVSAELEATRMERDAAVQRANEKHDRAMEYAEEAGIAKQERTEQRRRAEWAEAERDAAVAVLAAARRWGEARDALMQARDAGCFVAHEKQVFADASRGLRAALAAPDAAPVARERARDAVVAAARAYIAVRDVWQPDAMTEGDVFRALPDQAQREADAETRLRTALDALAPTQENR